MGLRGGEKGNGHCEAKKEEEEERDGLGLEGSDERARC